DRSSDLAVTGTFAELAAAVVGLERDLRDGAVDEPGDARVAAELEPRLESGRHVRLGIDVFRPGEGSEALPLARREEAEKVVPDFHITAPGARRARQRLLLLRPAF